MCPEMRNHFLIFNGSPYSQEKTIGFNSQFEETSDAILPEIFKCEKVIAFRKELEGVIYFYGLSHTIPEDSTHYNAKPMQQTQMKHSTNKKVNFYKIFHF
jgi:hypothetical protein